MRLEQASVSLNDLLGGAAPGNRACITPVPLGRREAPAQRLEFRGQKPRNARVLVPWNEVLGPKWLMLLNLFDTRAPSGVIS